MTWFTGLGGSVVDLGADGSVGDVDASYATWLEQLGATAVLQRPDAYVFGSASEPSILLEALRRQLG